MKVGDVVRRKYGTKKTGGSVLENDRAMRKYDGVGVISRIDGDCLYINSLDGDPISAPGGRFAASLFTVDPFLTAAREATDGV